MIRKLKEFNINQITGAYKKLGKNFGLLLIGNFASKLLNFFLVPLYTFYLTTSEYGFSDLLVTTVSLVSPLLTCSINEAVMRYALDSKYDKKDVFTVGVIINGFSFITFLILAPIFLLFGQFDQYMVLIIGYYFVYTGTLFVSQFIKGLDNVKQYTIAGIIQTITIITCNVIFLVILHSGIYGYLLSYVIGYSIGLGYQVFSLKLWTYISKRFRLNKFLLKKMMMYSFPLIANNLAWWVINSSDKYMINFFKDSSVLGIYSVSYKIPTILTTFTSMFAVSMRISSVENFGSEQTTKFINNTFNMYISLLIPITGTVILFCKVCAKVIFQKEFFCAWQSSNILLVGFLFYALAEYIGIIFLASENTKCIFKSCLFGALLNLCLNCILINKYGALGAAVATSASFALVWGYRMYKCRILMPLYVNMKKFTIAIVLLIGIVISMMFDKWITAILFLILDYVIYIIPKLKFIGSSKEVGDGL